MLRHGYLPRNPPVPAAPAYAYPGDFNETPAYAPTAATPGLTDHAGRPLPGHGAMPTAARLGFRHGDAGLPQTATPSYQFMRSLIATNPANPGAIIGDVAISPRLTSHIHRFTFELSPTGRAMASLDFGNPGALGLLEDLTGPALRVATLSVWLLLNVSPGDFNKFSDANIVPRPNPPIGLVDGQDLAMRRQPAHGLNVLDSGSSAMQALNQFRVRSEWRNHFVFFQFHDSAGRNGYMNIYTQYIRLDRHGAAIGRVLWDTIYKQLLAVSGGASSTEVFMVEKITIGIVKIPAGGCNRHTSKDGKFTLYKPDKRWYNPYCPRDECLLASILFSPEKGKSLIDTLFAYRGGDAAKYKNLRRLTGLSPTGLIAFNEEDMMRIAEYLHMVIVVWGVEVGVKFTLLRKFTPTSFAPIEKHILYTTENGGHFYAAGFQPDVEEKKCNCFLRYKGTVHKCCEVNTVEICAVCQSVVGDLHRERGCNVSAATWVRSKNASKRLKWLTESIDRNGLPEPETLRDDILEQDVEKRYVNPYVVTDTAKTQRALGILPTEEDFLDYDIETTSENLQVLKTGMIISVFRGKWSMQSSVGGRSPWKDFVEYLSTLKNRVVVLAGKKREQTELEVGDGYVVHLGERLEIPEFQQRCNDRKWKVYVIPIQLNAYNGSNFDHHFLMRYLIRNKKDLGIHFPGNGYASLGGRVLSQNFSIGDGMFAKRFVTWDLYQFFPTSSLKSLHSDVFKTVHPNEEHTTTKEWFPYEKFNDLDFLETSSSFEDFTNPKWNHGVLYDGLPLAELESSLVILPDGMARKLAEKGRVDHFAYTFFYCKRDVEVLVWTRENARKCYEEVFNLTFYGFWTARQYYSYCIDEIVKNDINCERGLLLCPKNAEESLRYRSTCIAGRTLPFVRVTGLPVFSASVSFRNIMELNGINPAGISHTQSFQLRLPYTDKSIIEEKCFVEGDISGMYAAAAKYTDFVVHDETALLEDEVARFQQIWNTESVKPTDQQDASFLYNPPIAFYAVVKPNRFQIDVAGRRRTKGNKIVTDCEIFEGFFIWSQLELMMRFHYVMEFKRGFRFPTKTQPFYREAVKVCETLKQEGKKTKNKMKTAGGKCAANAGIYGDTLMKDYVYETLVSNNEEEINKFMIKHHDWSARFAYADSQPEGYEENPEMIFKGIKSKYRATKPLLNGCQILAQAQLMLFNYLGIIFPAIYDLPPSEKEVMNEEEQEYFDWWLPRFTDMIKNFRQYSDTDCIIMKHEHYQVLTRTPASKHIYWKHMEGEMKIKYGSNTHPITCNVECVCQKNGEDYDSLTNPRGMTMISQELGFMKYENTRLWCYTMAPKNIHYLELLKAEQDESDLVLDIAFNATFKGVRKNQITMEQILKMWETETFESKPFLSFTHRGTGGARPDEHFEVKRNDMQRKLRKPWTGRTWVTYNEPLNPPRNVSQMRQCFHEGGNISLPHGHVILKKTPTPLEMRSEEDEENERKVLDKAFFNAELWTDYYSQFTCCGELMECKSKKKVIYYECLTCGDRREESDVAREKREELLQPLMDEEGCVTAPQTQEEEEEEEEEEERLQVFFLFSLSL